MSTYLRDLASNTKLYKAANQAAGSTGNTLGTSLDMITADGRCFAIQVVHTVNGSSPILAGKIQESTDGTTWTDVTGATFTNATTNNDLQIITFDRTKRYLGYYSTITGTGSLTIPFTALIGEQLKTV